ncbi:MAG TPA: tyrosine-type recombinase/integrase, partial [Acidimicrobiales bacterium]|nr:tyrosine-type recombinase/integrase [Acidimicrobiales bacterium]
MPRPLEAGAEEYLSWLAVERGRSPHTLAAYRHDLAAFEEWARAVGVRAAAPSTDDLERYLERLRASGCGPAAVARATAALRGLFRFLVDEGVGGSDPTAELRSPRLPRRLPKALSEQEVLDLLAAAGGPEPTDLRDRALLELLYATGARISEAVGLSLADLAGDDGLVRLFGKGSKERLVPLGDPARAALDRWLGGGGRPRMAPARWARRSDAEAVFLNARGARLSRQGAWAVVRARA